jgi:DUF218 domain
MTQITLGPKKVLSTNEFNNLVRPIAEWMGSPAFSIPQLVDLSKKGYKLDALVTPGCPEWKYVALRSAEVYHAGLSDVFIYSGKSGSLDKGRGITITEARRMANEAQRLGIPEEITKLEEESTNTGENGKKVASLLRGMGKDFKVLGLNKNETSIMRDLATWLKQFPDKDTKFVMTAPKIDVAFMHVEGFDGRFTREEHISIIVDDFGKMFTYATADKPFQVDVARKGLIHGPYNIEPAPNVARQAFLDLVSLRYGSDGFRDEKGYPLPIFK